MEWKLCGEKLLVCETTSNAYIQSMLVKVKMVSHNFICKILLYVTLCCYIFQCRLLDILADRKGRKGISGSVLVKGKRRPKNFKCISGYVVQVGIHKLSLVFHAFYGYFYAN